MPARAKPDANWRNFAPNPIHSEQLPSVCEHHRRLEMRCVSALLLSHTLDYVESTERRLGLVRAGATSRVVTENFTFSLEKEARFNHEGLAELGPELPLQLVFILDACEQF